MTTSSRMTGQGSGTRRSRGRWLAALALAASASCSSPLEPETLTGEYEARELVGRTVESIYGVPVRIAYAGVTISPGEVRRWILYEEPITTLLGMIGGEELSMQYEIEGRRLVTRVGGCPLEMLCLSMVPALDPPDYLVFGEHLVEVETSGTHAATYSKRGPIAMPLTAEGH